MSDELYYRGSSSYESAVTNQLEHIKDSNISLRNSMYDMEYGIRSDIRQSTYAVVASQQMLAQAFEQGFNSVNNTLQVSFEVMAQRFNILEDEMNVMSDKICSKLDEIQNIVNNPLLTQTRELFRRAKQNYEKGYYEEALEDCKQAIEKSKTDYTSWYLLGLIYLYGAGKYSNVINLTKAEEAFFNAVKYIDADINKALEDKDFSLFISKIYFDYGYTELLTSNDLLLINDSDNSNKKLLEASKYFQKASQFSVTAGSPNLFADYEYAKVNHFLGKDDIALTTLEKLMDEEISFSLKASNDKNFETIWNKIDTTIEKLRDKYIEKIKAQTAEIYSEAEKKINSVKQEVNTKYSSKEEYKDYSDKFILVKHLIDKGVCDIDIRLCERKIRENNEELQEDKKKVEIIIKKLKEEELSDSEISAYNELITKILPEKIEEYEEESADLQKIVGIITKIKKSDEAYLNKESIFKRCDDALPTFKSELEKTVQKFSNDYFTAKNAFESFNKKSLEKWFPFIKETSVLLTDIDDYIFYMEQSEIDLSKFSNLSAEDLPDFIASLDDVDDASEKKGCYVATAVYGSYDCPQVWTLRRFRDYELAETWYGRLFIHIYYAISPTIVKYFGETNWFKNMWRGRLDRLVKKLQSKGYQDTPYSDRNW